MEAAEWFGGVPVDEEPGYDFDVVERPQEVLDGPDQVWPTLRDLSENPELLKPPRPILERFLWDGRCTLFVAPDKAGKSTIAGHGTAAISRGDGSLWFGDQVEQSNVIVVAPDEALGDTVRRLVDLNADLDRVRVLYLRPPDLLQRLDEVLEAHLAHVIVDSLSEWARLVCGKAPEDGDASGWGSVVRPLVEMVCRKHGRGLLLLHHPRKSDGTYRGSGEIAAAVDCLIEMTTASNGEDPTLRRLRGRARWPVEDWSLRMVDGQYELGDGGPVSLEARILMDTGVNPGTSRTAQHDRLRGRKQTYLATVGKLLVNDGLKERSGKLFLPSDVEEDLA